MGGRRISTVATSDTPTSGRRAVPRLGIGLGRGLRGFLAWWRVALAAWLPVRARRVLGLDRGRLLLQPEADGVELRLQQGADVHDLGHVPLLGEDDPLARVLTPRIADLPRWLLLPAGHALRRPLLLPAAAADRLRDVVGFEIDRQTPFAADAVVFDARVLGRRGPQIEAELIAVPRARVEPLTAALGPLAGTLAGIDVAGPDGVPLGVNVLDPVQRRTRRDPLRGWNWALAAFAVLALAAAGAQLLDNREAAALTLEAQIASKARAAQAAAAERAELLALIEGQKFLDRARTERPSTLAVIDELTRRLPDDTHLEKLAIEDSQILLIGLSSEPSGLVARLQGSPLWKSPALTGALMPDPVSRKQRFTLVAEPTGNAPPAAPAGADDASATAPAEGAR